MFSQIKVYAIAAAGFVMAVLFALLQVEKRKRVEFQAKVDKKVTDIRGKADQANLKGAVDEHETMNKPIDKIEDDF